MRTVTRQELCEDINGFMRRVESGETFVVTDDDRPFAEIRSIRAGRQRSVSRERLLALAKDLEPIDRHRFRADLDAVIDPWSQP